MKMHSFSCFSLSFFLIFQHICSHFVSILKIHNYYANKGHCKGLFIKHVMFTKPHEIVFQALGPMPKMGRWLD